MNREANREEGVLAAIEVGPEAGRILARRQSGGKVFLSLPGAVYFLTDDQEFFWVGADSSPMHRRGVLAPFLPPRGRVRPGQRFRAEPLLMLGESFSLDLRRAKEWSPPPVLPDRAPPLASVRERGELLFEFLRFLRAGDGPGRVSMGLWGGAEEREIPPARAAASFPKSFRPVFEIGKACRRRDMTEILRNGKELIGLGPGLTPSGDDFLGGLLFSAFFLKKAYPDIFSWDQDRVAGFLSEARSRTHPVSHVFLGDLAAGHGPAPLYGVLGFLLRGGDFEEAVLAVVQTLKFGHSSGGDMLAGLMTGMGLLSGGPFTA